MKWKLKKYINPLTITDDFWYSITDGGYIKPENYLSDEDQINKIKEAVRMLECFRDALEDRDLLEYV